MISYVSKSKKRGVTTQLRIVAKYTSIYKWIINFFLDISMYNRIKFQFIDKNSIPVQ